jgi:tetratricopeptide (TPR) repeat protein
MHQVKLAICLLACASLVAAGCAQTKNRPSAYVSSLSDACTIALAPGAQKTDRDRQIARVQQDAHGERAALALERLGYLYVSRARVSNDPGDYKLAEMSAACLDSRSPGEPAALLLRGHVLHQLHRFHAAEQIARTLVARRTVVLDYGLLGDTLMEQGRLAEAAAAYQKMIDLKPFYQSYTRASHLRWLKGDLEGAIGAMRMAIESASPRDPESSAWAWTRMAAYELQAGRLDSARDATDRALQHQPDYAAALLMKGRTLLASHHPAGAVAPLRRAAELNPLPEYEWTLADALRSQGLAAEAAVVEHKLVERGATDDPRTLALFLATRRMEPARAVALTEQELRNRADVFTIDSHAWALAAGGRVEEALEEIQRAVREGTNDGRLFLHAAVIHAQAGRTSEANRWLRTAERLSVMLLPSEKAELSKQLARSRRGA